MINKTIQASCHSKGYDDKELYGAYKIFFGTLVSEPRLKIINFLRKRKANVSQITKELNMGQTSVSHNLKRLKVCGFVNSEKENKFRYYSLNTETIGPLMERIDKHMTKHCIHILKNTREAN
jgi:DNA-binding transcriptional ArsR family regulator